MDVKGRNALVIGMARSGIASAKLLCEEGASVTINDSKTAEKLSGLEDSARPQCGGLRWVNRPWRQSREKT